jgi:hypothetical protein
LIYRNHVGQTPPRNMADEDKVTQRWWARDVGALLQGYVGVLGAGGWVA